MDTLDELIRQHTDLRIRQNAIRNVAVNPDASAKLKQEADLAGVPYPQAFSNPDTFHAKLAADNAANPSLSPIVRNMLADRYMSTLIANEPPEFDRLSTIGRLVEDAKSGITTFKQMLAHMDYESADTLFETQGIDRQSMLDAGLQPEYVDALIENMQKLWYTKEDKAKAQAEAITEISELEASRKSLIRPEGVFDDGIWSAVVEDPNSAFNALFSVARESVASQGPFILAGAVASAVNPALGVTTMGTGSYAVDYTSTFLDVLRDAGVDVSDKEALTKAVSNVELVTRAKEVARRHATAVGFTDALAFGLGSASLHPIVALSAAKKSLMDASTRFTQAYAKGVKELSPGTRALTGAINQVGAGATLGMTGEATGQLYAYGEINDLTAVILEGLVEGVTAPVEVLSSRATARRMAVQDAAAVSQAQVAYSSLSSAVDTAAQSSLAGRDPATAKSVFNQMAESSGVETVVVDAASVTSNTAFMQAVVKVSPELADALVSAAAKGQSITIATGDLVAVGAVNPEGVKEVLRKARTTDEGMTLEEAEAYLGSASDKVKQIASELTTQAVAVQAENAALDTAVAPLVEQVRTARGISARDAKTEVAVFRGVLRNVARQMGITPQEFMERYKPNVVVGENPNSASTFYLQTKKDKDAPGTPTVGFVVRPGGKVAQNEALGTYDPASNTIFISPEADASTFLHEQAHFWLATMSNVVASAIERVTTPEMKARLSDPNLTPEERQAIEIERLNALTIGETEMYTTLTGFLVWTGYFKNAPTLDDFVSWANLPVENQRQYHEQFARGFEAYLMNGQAPTKELRSVFSRFKEWLKDIYKALAMTNVSMSPEVVALYDRLFSATQRAVDYRNGEPVVTGGVRDMVLKFLPKSEATEYEQRMDSVLEEAESIVISQRMSEDALLATARSKDRKRMNRIYKSIFTEMRKTLVDPRAEKARQAFSSKGIPNGDSNLTIRIDRETAKKSMTEEQYKFFSNKRWLVSEGGMPAVMASSLLGFKNPADMALSVMATYDPAMDAKAMQMADAEYIKRYGGVASLKDIVPVPTAEADLREAELRAAERAAKVEARKNRRKAIEAEVREFVRSVLTRDLKKLATDYKKKAKAYGEEAEQLASLIPNDDGATAAELGKRVVELKDAQLVATIYANQLTEALARQEKMKRALHRLTKTATIEASFFGQLVRIANIFGVSSVPDDPGVQTLSAFLKNYEEETGVALPVAEWILDDGIPSNTDTMTIEHMSDVADLVDMLIHHGRADEKENIIDAQKKTVGTLAALDAASAGLSKKLGRKDKKFEADTTTYFGKIALKVRGFFAAHLKASSIFAFVFDGNGNRGIAFNTFMKRAMECTEKENTMQEYFSKRLFSAYEALMANNEEVQIPGFSTPQPRRVLLAMALNCGNEGNLQRLMDGHNLTADQVRAALSLLTPEELSAVQEIWGLFAELRPQVEELERKQNGVAPRMVEAKPFTVITRTGQRVDMAGGYFPIVYSTETNERRAVRNTELLDTANATALQVGYTTSTRRTYTYERAKSVDAKLRLDPVVALNSMSMVIHDLCWREFCQDTSRLFRGVNRKTVVRMLLDGSKEVVELPGHKGVIDIVKTRVGAPTAEQLDFWLRNIATNGQVYQGSALNDTLALVRSGVALAGLGFSVINAVIQVTGLIPAATRIGVRGVLKGVMELSTSPRDTYQLAMMKSKTMRFRNTTRLRELREITSLESSAGKLRRGAYRAGYALMGAVQTVIDTAVWMGAYKQALAKGMSDSDAAFHADAVVNETQGSANIADQSNIESGNEIAKMLTVFYSFMNTAYNLNAMSWMGETSRAKAVAQILTISVVLPVIDTLFREAIVPDSDDKEDKDFAEALRSLLGSVVSHNLGLVVLSREIASAVGSAVGGDPVFPYRGPSGLRLFTDIGEASKQIAQGDFDEGAVNAAANLLGATVGFPAAQFRRTVTGTQALMEGETDNPAAIIFGVGK